MPFTEEEERQGRRWLWICAVAVAHANSSMPWRAAYPSEDDLAWADQVGEAVIKKRARPQRPDPEIEQLLSDALPT